MLLTGPTSWIPRREALATSGAGVLGLGAPSLIAGATGLPAASALSRPPADPVLLEIGWKPRCIGYFKKSEPA